MEIKTTQQVINECGMVFGNIRATNKKWIAVDDYNKLLSLTEEMFRQLELMDYERKAKETYDEFKDELKSLSTL